jgi:hypothetical protein
MNIPLIGNCKCCAYILKFIYGGKIFTIKREIGPKGIDIPHYMLRKPNGRIVHFKRICNILPPPFSNILFIGIIETSGNKKRRQ